MGGAEDPDLLRHSGGVFALPVGAGFQPVGAAQLPVGNPGSGRGGEEEADEGGEQNAGEAGHDLVLNGQPHHRLALSGAPALRRARLQMRLSRTRCAGKTVLSERAGRAGIS